MSEDTPVSGPSSTTRFVCKVCGNTFDRRDILNEPRLGAFYIRWRAYSSMTARDLKGESPYKCNLCDRAFPNRQGFERHQSNVHMTSNQSKNYSTGFITDFDHDIRMSDDMKKREKLDSRMRI
jgi:hypothetical protein